MKKREYAIIFTLGLVILSLGIFVSAEVVVGGYPVPNPGHSIHEIAPPLLNNEIPPANAVLGWIDGAWDLVSGNSGGESFWESAGDGGIGYSGGVVMVGGPWMTSGILGGDYGAYGGNSNGNLGYLGGAKFGVRGANNNGNFGYLGGISSGAYGKNSNGNYGYLGGEDYGAYGKNSNGNYGYIGSTTSGVYGYSSSGRAVYGRSSTGYAGYFGGDVKVTGDLDISGDVEISGTLKLPSAGTAYCDPGTIRYSSAGTGNLKFCNENHDWIGTI